MKIFINEIKTTPSDLGFNFCVFGEPSNEILEWCRYWNLTTVTSGQYTNIILNDNFSIKDAFNLPMQYDYIDGFSPNLNKKLHVGHLSNLVLANAFQSLNIGKKFIAIFGDTLSGIVNNDDALKSYYSHCDNFSYKVDEVFFASQMKLEDESLLTDGDGSIMAQKYSI